MTPILHLFKLASNACGTKTGFLPSLYDNIPCDTNGVPQLKSVSEVGVIVANVARILIAVSGGLAIIFVIVGAIYYITSAGEPSRIKRAKDILVNATIGILLIVTAYAVVTFIAQGF